MDGPADGRDRAGVRADRLSAAVGPEGLLGDAVATGIMGSVPGGEPLQHLVQGGSEYGNLTLTRFFALHVFVLPIALAGLLGVHLLLFRKHGVTPPDLPEAELKRKTQPFWPNQLFLDVLAMAVCAAVLVGLTVKTHGAELFAPADPASTSSRGRSGTSCSCSSCSSTSRGR